MNSGHLSKQQGVSLVEILITISIMVVALSLAAPSLSSFIENNRMTSATNKLVSAINYARNEAVTRREAIRIRGDDDGWELGIPVDVDDVNSDLNPILAVYDLDTGIIVDPGDDFPGYIQFTANGYRDLTLNTTPFTFLVCDPDIDFNRSVAVNAAGNTSVTKGTGGCPDES